MPLLPRFARALERQEDLRRVGEAVAAAEGNAGEPPGTVARATLPGDRRRLRGIPVHGRGSGGGAIPGTDPLQALLHKEARGRQRRR